MHKRDFGLGGPGVEARQFEQPRPAVIPENGTPANTGHDEALNHGPWHGESEEDYYYDDDILTEMPSLPTNSRPHSPSFLQLPPLPLSPISPRWDSLQHNTGNYIASAAAPESRPGSGGKVLPPQLPEPLGSHPVSPEQRPTFPSNASLRAFPPLEQAIGGPRYHRPITPSSSTTRSFMTDSSTPMEGEPTIENFSRPRKPSIRQGNAQFSPVTDHFTSIATLNPTMHETAWARDRGFSTSSVQSTNTTNTFASLPHRPSDTQTNLSYRTASVRRPNPVAHMAKPQLSYTVASAPSTPREPPPWMLAGNDETSSSVRSQLSATTHLGTVFTSNGTERSSIMTKTSSVTESLIINGYARASMAEGDEDDLSLEDVMGMYANGFHDDSDEEDDSTKDKNKKDDLRDNDKTPRAAVPDESARPPVTQPIPTKIVDRMLEAMTEPPPLPESLPLSVPRPFVARDSAAIFRNSGLPSSLPKDSDIRLVGDRVGRDATEEDVEKDEVAQKHDSTKTLIPDSQEGDVRYEFGVQLSRSDLPTPVLDDPAQRSLPRVLAPPLVAMLPLEPEEDPRSRDRYGFRKANPYISLEQYDTWNASYTEYLARRRKKWMGYMKDNSLMTDHPDRFPPRSAKTKRFVRKGIPPDWRGAAWFYYAGGPGILAKHPGVYDDLVRKAGLDPVGAGKLGDGKTTVKPLVVEDIEKDLHRTFPDNVRFKPPKTTKVPPSSPATTEDSQMTLTNKFPDRPPSETPAEPEIISSLRRVLHAFALYNPRIGYCQSLNFLAGLLLLFVESEEHAFWLLNVITRVYLPGTHEMSLEGSKVDLGVLMGALKESLPNVWKQIGGDEADPTVPPPKRSRGRRFRDGHASGPEDPNRLPAITLCMTAWFMSCFIGTLPIETVLRVWDIFFYEGSRTLFRIALTIFKTGEAEIKSVRDPMEMFGVVQSIPRRMLDCNALLEACYKRRNGIGHLTQDIVEERRQERRDGIRRWKAAQDAGNNPVAAVAAKEAAAAARLDLDADMSAAEASEVRRKGTLFGPAKGRNRERARAADVL